MVYIVNIFQGTKLIAVRSADTERQRDKIIKKYSNIPGIRVMWEEKRDNNIKKNK